MLGLARLEQEISPHSTFEKFLFLIENAALHEHRPTTLISFIALAALVLFRFTKTRFRANRIISKITELLLVVIVSTGTSVQHPSKALFNDRLIALCQRFRWNEIGVDILGEVPIKTEARTFVRFPIHGRTLRYMTRTTPQAM